MILFAAAWGFDDAGKRRLRTAVASYARDTFGLTSVGSFDSGGACVAWAHTGSTAEVVATDSGVTIVEGICLADGAAVDATSPPDFSRELDGQFTVVEARAEGVSFRSDDVGLMRLYWAQAGAGWMVSNRAEMVARVVGSALDLAGAASFLSLGWVDGERTLASGVETVPAGSTWSWPVATGAPVQRGGYLASLARLPRKDPSIVALAETLSATCAVVANAAGSIEAPLTAGLDSRLVLALLRASGTTAHFVTEGWERSVDVVAGRTLAAANGLAHTVYPPLPGAAIKAQWPALARRMVAENDGLVSLWHAASLTRSFGTGALAFWGIGGEICRGYFTNPAELIPGRSGRTTARLLEAAGNAHGLLTQSAQAQVRAHVAEFEHWALDAGFRVADLPDAFYLAERVGRWSAASSRKAVKPLFAPLATKPFVEAAFSMSAARRCGAPLHYRLLSRLAPDLHAFPVQKGGWPSQHPAYTVARAVARDTRRGRRPQQRRAPVREQDVLVETVRDEIAAASLDRASSPLWEIVDRGRCEQLLRGPAEERAMAAPSLLVLATLFEYEAFRASGATTKSDGVIA